MEVIIVVAIVMWTRTWWKSTEYHDYKEWTFEDWMNYWDRERRGY